MLHPFRPHLALALLCLILPLHAAPEATHLAKAKEVTAAIQEKFWMPEKSLYRTRLGTNDAETVWGSGVLFSMLTGAARHEPQTYRSLIFRFYDGLEGYWDSKVKIPGYEPCPTKGGGNDKYYDDNAWMVITFAEAYQMTGEQKFIHRANDTLTFVMSGWDDTLGGGIWWHERHNDDSKNTCSNAPSAVACLTLAKYNPVERRKRMIQRASEIVSWTQTNLQAENGLYMDHIKSQTRKINRATLTYNAGLMLRAELMLHEATGDAAHLAAAKHIAAAADLLCRSGTHVYRDPARWSHLMIEADLELYRKTGDAQALARATENADAFYQQWKEHGDMSLIDQASVARTLWLMVDTETESGRAFWKKMDAPGK